MITVGEIQDILEFIMGSGLLFLMIHMALPGKKK